MLILIFLQHARPFIHNSCMPKRSPFPCAMTEMRSTILVNILVQQSIAPDLADLSHENYIRCSYSSQRRGRHIHVWGGCGPVVIVIIIARWTKIFQTFFRLLDKSFQINNESACYPSLLQLHSRSGVQELLQVSGSTS